MSRLPSPKMTCALSPRAGLLRPLLLLVTLCPATTGSSAHRSTCAVASEGAEIVFDCGGELISSVNFASFGTPRGSCEAGEHFTRVDDCHYTQSESTLEDRCLGQSTCLFTIAAASFGPSPPCKGATSDKRWLSAVFECADATGDKPPTAIEASRSVGLGWRLIAIMCLLFGIYCGLGVVYNVRRNGARGLEALPHLEMWKDLPSLVRDGVVFSVDTIKSKASGQYDTVL